MMRLSDTHLEYLEILICVATVLLHYIGLGVPRKSRGLAPCKVHLYQFPAA